MHSAETTRAQGRVRKKSLTACLLEAILAAMRYADTDKKNKDYRKKIYNHK